MKSNYWYAIVTNDSDDWSTGSMDLEESLFLLKKHPGSYIAIIDNGVRIGDVCREKGEMYAFIDLANDDEFDEVYDNLEDAARCAERNWNFLSPSQKGWRQAFFVTTCKLDEDGAIDHESFDTVIKRYC